MKSSDPERDKAMTKYLKNVIRRDSKKKKTIFDKLDSILLKRITNYVDKSKDFKWDTKVERSDFIDKLFSDVQERYLGGMERTIEKAIIKKKQLNFDLYDSQQLCKDLDEIICSIDERFLGVVEFKPHKDNNSTSKKKQKKKEKSHYNLKGKQTKKTLRGRNYDKEIEGYISCSLKFYNREENKNKRLNHNEVAKYIGTSPSTISRRFNEEAPKFIPRFENILKDELNEDYRKLMNKKPLTDKRKSILLDLKDEIDDRVKNLEKRKKDLKNTPENVGNVENLDADKIQKEKPRSNKVSKEGEDGKKRERKEELYNAVEEVKKNRTCDRCGKIYTIKFNEDDDIEKWERDAKKDPKLYLKLVCSPKCFISLLKEKGVTIPGNFNMSEYE